MPHIIILGEWIARLEQLDGYAHQLDNYSGSDPNKAAALRTQIDECIAGDLNAETIDNLISDIETFLEI